MESALYLVSLTLLTISHCWSTTDAAFALMEQVEEKIEGENQQIKVCLKMAIKTSNSVYACTVAKKIMLGAFLSTATNTSLCYIFSVSLHKFFDQPCYIHE